MRSSNNRKRFISLSSFFALLLILGIMAGCSGETDDQSRLQQLVSERARIDKQLREVEQRMAENGEAVRTAKIPPVTAMEIKPEVFTHFIQVRGTVESDNNIFVPAQRPNIVTRILVTEGDYVNSGQLLAELDNESIIQSRNEIKNALELARTLYERQKNLHEKNIGTEVQYLQSKSQLDNLEIKLKSVENELEKTRIFSPIDGVVDHIAIKEGEAAIPNAGAIRVANFSALKIRARLAENLISQVKRGDPVRVLFPIPDIKLEMQISAVSKVIDPQNRTFDIEVKLPDNPSINPNMQAMLTIKTYENPEALVVPMNALQRTENENLLFVAVKKNDQWIAELRKVTLGRLYDNRAEILSGLNQNDVVITFGINNVTPGEPVNPSFSAL
jgi:membrane fusion protein, multidrug efflux system